MKRIGMVGLSVMSLCACSMFGGSDDAKESTRTQQPPGEQRTMQSDRAVAASSTASQSPEARLLGFLNLANKGDFEGGRMAQMRGSSAAVRTYARQMETDHMQMLQDSENAARSLGIIPVMGPETQPLVRDHETAMQRLQSAHGKDFDRAYMAHEIEMHQQVLQTAQAMAGQVRNPELKKLLANSKPILEAHLKAAQTLAAE
jgi:putative membrane protein